MHTLTSFQKNTKGNNRHIQWSNSGEKNTQGVK